MKQKGNRLLDVCRRELAFLHDRFAFAVVEESCTEGSVVFRTESACTGVVVEFEPQIVYPRLFLYAISTPGRRVELNAVLKGRAPHLVYPTETTDSFLTDMVQRVLAGKRTNAQTYPEDISFDNVLSKYALALREALADVLDGDFSKVPRPKA